ncbi:MAG: hypothetical protein ACOCRX_09405, partial [Candidatus Woesearchaeota archaeon]
VLASFYAFNRKRKFRRNKFFKVGLEEIKRLERDKKYLAEYQVHHLKEILKFSINNIPFYSNYIEYSDPFQTLSQFPILKKKNVINNWEDFQYYPPKLKVMHSNTSGSTGTSLSLRISENCTGYERADIVSFRGRAGYKPGDKIASFIGRKIMKIDTKKPPFWRYNFIDNQLIFSYWHLSDYTIDSYIDKLIEFNPKYIHGYPSFINLIANFINRKKIPTINPTAIFTSSETLLPEQKLEIEKAFNSKIYDRYGLAEMVISASQCEYGEYHVNPLLGYMEIKNNKIIGTSYHNFAMPLIRYEVGDLSDFKNIKCKCGRITSIIKQPEGRKEDVIISKNGRIFGRIPHLLKGAKGILESQVVQKDYENLIINIVPENINNIIIKDINDIIKDKLGNLFNIDIQLVDYIERTPSGKFKFVKSEISQNHDNL